MFEAVDAKIRRACRGERGGLSASGIIRQSIYEVTRERVSPEDVRAISVLFDPNRLLGL